MAYQNPGKVLLDQYLAPAKLSQNALARAIGVPPRRINEIILGKRSITADTAVRLGTYFGNSASYWMHLQSDYDINMAREKIGLQLNMIKTPHLDISRPASSLSNNCPDEAVSHTRQQQNIRKRILR